MGNLISSVLLITRYHMVSLRVTLDGDEFSASWLILIYCTNGMHREANGAISRVGAGSRLRQCGNSGNGGTEKTRKESEKLVGCEKKIKNTTNS